MEMLFYRLVAVRSSADENLVHGFCGEFPYPLFVMIGDGVESVIIWLTRDDDGEFALQASCSLES